MIRSIVILFLITLIPGLELRASIPLGIFGGDLVESPLAWQWVVLVCVISNILIGWAFFLCLHPLVCLFRKMEWCDRLLKKYLDRAQEKLKPQVEKYGFWGVAVFIGIPLPMTGAYTGAAGAYALGMKRRKFMVANVVGVLIAGICVTIVCLLIKSGVDSPFLQHFIKQ